MKNYLKTKFLSWHEREREYNWFMVGADQKNFKEEKMKKFLIVFFMLTLISYNFLSFARSNEDEDHQFYGEKIFTLISEDGQVDVYKLGYIHNSNNDTVSLMYVFDTKNVVPVTIIKNNNSGEITILGKEDLLNELSSRPALISKFENKMIDAQTQLKSSKRSALKCALAWIELAGAIASGHWESIPLIIYNIACYCYEHCI